MLFSAALKTSAVAICTAWNFPRGPYEGSAQDPYIVVTCNFHNTGAFPTVLIEAQCDPGKAFSTTETFIGLKRDPNDPVAFIAAAPYSPYFQHLMNDLNVLCPDRHFTIDDFSKFKVTSKDDELMIRIDGRYVSIKKSPSYE